MIIGAGSAGCYLGKLLGDQDIWELREKSIKEISGGEFQRVIIARALTQKAEIILKSLPSKNTIFLVLSI